MSGLVIPTDRTTKQPVKAICRNPECAGDRTYFEFEAQHDRFCCPKCGANRPPMIDLLVLTHLLVKNKNGPIEGESGIRWQIACDTRRAYLATATNLEAATTAKEVANCPGCLISQSQIRS